MNQRPMDHIAYLRNSFNEKKNVKGDDNADWDIELKIYESRMVLICKY